VPFRQQNKTSTAIIYISGTYETTRMIILGKIYSGPQMPTGNFGVFGDQLQSGVLIT
jgi:hypothetical protein